MSGIPKEIRYKPIGIIHSPHKDIKGTPIQPTGAKGIRGTVEIKKKYAGGQKDLEGFSHIILIYHFHLSEGYSLEVKPFLDDSLRGVFSTRAPKRPNPIGISIRLRRVCPCHSNRYLPPANPAPIPKAFSQSSGNTSMRRCAFFSESRRSETTFE